MSSTDIYADVQLFRPNQLAGGSTTLSVSVTLPANRARTRLFLKVAPELTVGNVRFFGGRRMISVDALQPSKEFSGHPGTDVDPHWSWGSRMLLADIAERGLFIGDDAKSSLLLSWSMTVQVCKMAADGDKYVSAYVLCDHQDEVVASHSSHIVVTDVVGDTPFQFSLNRRKLTVHNGAIWLSGAFKFVAASDVALICEYAVDGGIYREVAEFKYHSGDRFFSALLHDDAFKEEKAYTNVRIRIGAAADRPKAKFYEIGNIIVVVNNKSPSFIDVALRADKGALIASGKVKGAKGRTVDNPVEEVDVNWEGVEDKAGGRVVPTLVDSRDNLWSFAISTPMTAVKEVLNPILMAKNRAGLRAIEHFVFPDARGLVGTAFTIGGRPIVMSWSDEEGVFLGTSPEPRDGASVSLECSIQFNVSLRRVNVNAEFGSGAQVKLQDGKKIATERVRGDDGGKLERWNGRTNTELFAVPDIKKGTVFRLAFPLTIGRKGEGGANRDTWDFVFTISDVEMLGGTVRSAFRDSTRYVLKFH